MGRSDGTGGAVRTSGRLFRSQRPAVTILFLSCHWRGHDLGQAREVDLITPATAVLGREHSSQVLRHQSCSSDGDDSVTFQVFYILAVRPREGGVVGVDNDIKPQQSSESAFLRVER